MFGIRYVKVSPTTYVIHYRRGEIVREGVGLSFFYFGPNSVIVQVPAGSVDVPFVFNETSADFQEITISGSLTYRVVDPKKLSSMLDYSLDAYGRPRSTDPDNLNDRLIQAAQVAARSFTQQHAMARILVGSNALVEEIEPRLQASGVVDMLGIEVLDLSIGSIKPTPEMAKALQAEAREQLLQQADEAIHVRRNTAVELERQIKENELKTEIAVEEKRREVRQTKIRADIAVEEERAALVEKRVANDRQEAESRAHALRAVLEPVKEVDWRTLMTVVGGMDSKQLIALAFRDLADNAERIGQLNVSSELLATLLGGPAGVDPTHARSAESE